MIIYTCIIGDYDWLLPPVWRSDDIDFLCYTDRPSRSVKGWKLIPMDRSLEGLPPALINRWYKLHPHEHLPQKGWSLYMDGHIRIISDLRRLLSEAQHKGSLMVLPTHPYRTSIWEEAEACLDRGKILPQDAAILKEQLMFYKNQGFDSQVPLTENNILIRKHGDSAVKTAMIAWWKELEQFTKRDQLSLPYVIWKERLPVLFLPYSAKTANPFFRFVPHRNRNVSVSSYLDARQHHGPGWQLTYQGLRALRFLSRNLDRSRLG